MIVPKGEPGAAGTLFVIGLLDGSQCVGQVISREKAALNSILCAFTLRDPSSLETSTQLAFDDIVSVQLTSDEYLADGRWKLLGQRPLPTFECVFDIQGAREDGFIGSKVIGCAIIESLLNACRCLEPWDDWHDPQYLDGLLVSPDRKPDLVLYKSELPKQ